MESSKKMPSDIHQDQKLLSAGKPLEKAKAVMIMIHGRGASAADILSLTDEFRQPAFAYVAPQAAANSWYPYRFLEPLEMNEPGISSGLKVIDELILHMESLHILSEKIILLGFSQGACLVLEYAARHPRRYGGIIGLSGGLIGSPETPRDYPGSLQHTPIFLGCSDMDFHIPKERVEESALVFQKLGGMVDIRLYPDMGHTINQDEIETVKTMMSNVLKSLE
jgi:predicted esterase